MFISVDPPDASRHLSFISSQIYEGRLTSHATLREPVHQFGTGLRWLRAHHAERSTESMEEAQLVATQISTMLGTRWINQHGESKVLAGLDFMVVAPYNDQVRLLVRGSMKRRDSSGCRLARLTSSRDERLPWSSSR